MKHVTIHPDPIDMNADTLTHHFPYLTLMEAVKMETETFVLMRHYSGNHVNSLGYQCRHVAVTWEEEGVACQVHLPLWEFIQIGTDNDQPINRLRLFNFGSQRDFVCNWATVGVFITLAQLLKRYAARMDGPLKREAHHLANHYHLLQEISAQLPGVERLQLSGLLD